MSYIQSLFEQFKDVKFTLKNFDNGNTPQSMQCYLLASNLSKEALKNKGNTALDLGNYIFRRYGFVYQHGPEYGRDSEPRNSLAFYQSRAEFESENNAHIREWILKFDKTERRAESVLYRKDALEIPHVAPYLDYVAVQKKTGNVVLIRKGQFTEVIFEADGKDIVFMQAELGPESDFEIVGEL